MTVEMFLALLSIFSVITGFTTESIKKITDKKMPYNLLSLCVALIIGCIGMFVYFKLNHIQITTDHIIYTVLMGFATGLTSQLSYDKIKQAILQINQIK